MNRLVFYTFLLFFSTFAPKTSAVQCKNENNESVDWFVAYKIPKLKHNNKLILEGVAYVYITPAKLEWTLSEISINSSDSIIGKTLQPLFLNRSNETSYIIYNDQPPDEPSKAEKGHTKGVVLATSSGGLLLVHSVPHFPKLSQEYKFSKTGVLKGQSFLCVSLDLKNLNKVGVQLQYNEPQVYATNITSVLNAKVPELVKAAGGVVITEPPWYNQIVLTTINDTKFISFAKSGKFKKDLYEDWVAPTLQTDLFTETWLNGAGRLPSNCSKTFKVYNIKSVSINVANVSFKDTQDHSKWAVSTNLSWICIGDINRMEHQKLRGGGTLCLNNQIITQDYRNSIESIEKCPK